MQVVAQRDHRPSFSLHRISTIMLFISIAMLVITAIIISFLVTIFLQERMDVMSVMSTLGTPVNKITEPYLKQILIYSVVSSLLAIGFISIAILLCKFISPWLYDLVELVKFFIQYFSHFLSCFIIKGFYPAFRDVKP